MTPRGRPFAAATALAIAVPLLILFGALRIGFLYDDGRMVVFNTGGTDHLGRAFLELRDGFYRPVYEVVIGLAGNLFGIWALPYHLLSLLVHGLCAGLVYHVARRRYGVTPALLAGLLFFGAGTHAEAVVWISAINSLLATLACLAALACLAEAGRAQTGRAARWWCAGALLAWLAGLLSKENAYPLPLATALLGVFTASTPALPRLRRYATFFAPAFAVMLIYAPLRIAAGTSYQIDLTLPLLAKNAVYYILSLVPIPDSYRHLNDLDLWRTSPWLAAGCLLAAAPALICLVRTRRSLAIKPAAGWLIWTAIMAVPVLPIVAERENYPLTAGGALALAALVRGLPSANEFGKILVAWPPLLGRVAVALLFAGQWAVLAERVYWWNEASTSSARIVAGTLAVLAADPPETRLVAFNVPDHLHYAHVQGIHFCWTLNFVSRRRLAVEDCRAFAAPEGSTSFSEDFASRAAPGAFSTGDQPLRVIVFNGDQIAATRLLSP